MDKNIFRAYDIRGKYPKEINEEAIAEIIPAIINILKPKIIVVGHDTRLSSPSLYRAAINSVNHQISNIKFIKIGTATTPMFYFLVNRFKADGGIMITASHNPKEYNGIKIVGKNAAPISGKEILKWII